MIGQLVANYRITKRLGVGGMGEVYLGEHTLIGRLAAIKVLLHQISRDQTVVQRFFNEARATALIRHPGLVDMLDFGYLPDGSAFLVMELLDGENLADRLRREPRPPLRALVEIGRQVALALVATHRKGIVHRDLKPDNLFLVPSSELAGGLRVKVLDFGIAKLRTEDAGGVKTRTEDIFGTPQYMAPEQCRGAIAVDGRADIYALGCILFEMACGRRPFDGIGPGELIAKHIFEEPPAPRSLVPSLPPALDALILSMLAKSLTDRPAIMEEVAAALEAMAKHLPIAAEELPTAKAVPVMSVLPQASAATTLLGGAGEITKAPSSVVSRRPPALWITGGLAVVLLALASWWWGLRPSFPLPSTTQVLREPLPTVAAPAPKIQRQPEVTPSETQTPPRVHWSFDSFPPGASVVRKRDGVVLGKTPLRIEQTPTAGPVNVRFDRSGFDPVDRSIDGNRDSSMEVVLNAKAKPPANDKRRKDDDEVKIVNPYDR